ncbi:hypothetical protein [Oceanobacillus oncorhynchi]|uniref:hypothetical protein n=1 Tax=Oceanobacillus oncorhynchi TaxID=545501 RepID=UPI0034D5FA0C
MFLKLNKSRLAIKFSEIEAFKESEDGKVFIYTKRNSYAVKEPYGTIMNALKNYAEQFHEG